MHVLLKGIRVNGPSYYDKYYFIKTKAPELMLYNLSKTMGDE